MSQLAAATLLAYHDGTSGGGGGGAAPGGSMVLLFVFLGVLATAGWLIFSEMRWATTVTIAAVGWVAGIALMFLI